MRINNKEKYIIIPILCICKIIILQSCSCDFRPRPPQYGIEFNEIRKEIGLPVLSENWRYNGKFDDYFTKNKIESCNWYKIIPYEERKNPHYWYKEIFFNENSVLYEINEYIGGYKISTFEHTDSEKLTIRYNFIEYEDTFGNKYNIGWEYKFKKAYKYELENIPYFLNRSKEESEEFWLKQYYFKTINISKEEAIEILNLWGLQIEGDNI